MAPPEMESPAPTAIGNRADFEANAQAIDAGEDNGSHAEGQEVPLSNSLADLAERVREAGAAVADAERTAVNGAAAAGVLLCQAKDQCRHGQWLLFLDRAGVAERQAQRFMRLARAGLKSDTLSDLGSVSGALDYIGRLKLPAPSDLIFVDSTVPRRDGDAPICAWISHSAEHPGYFQVTSIRGKDDVQELVRPVLGQTVRGPDGQFFNGLWAAIDLLVAIPVAEREFTAMPAELIDRVDDCPWLGDVQEPVDIHALDTKNAPLPLSYQRVAECLDRCEASLTEANVIELQRLMSICLARSEQWPEGRKMMATYARIANENRMSERVARVHDLALLKWNGRIPGGADGPA